jgi:hypothetical protein
MERTLKAGERLSGSYANLLSNSPDYLKEEAKKALRELGEDGY